MLTIERLSLNPFSGVVPENGHHLTLSDIKKNVIISKDIHSCPTRLICLENTLGGTVLPLLELRTISAFAKEHNIRIHLDGARLWEAVAAGHGSLTDYVALVDSVSLCFSKGLGAPAGSILIGKKDFIAHARWVRKSIGGGLRQTGVLTSAMRVALDETFGTDVDGKNGKLRATHAVAKRIAARWEELGGKLEFKTETNMVWLNLVDAGTSAAEFVKLGKQEGLKLLSGRLVVHYQISEEAVEKLERLMEKVLENKADKMNGSNRTTGREAAAGERVYGFN